MKFREISFLMFAKLFRDFKNSIYTFNWYHWQEHFILFQAWKYQNLFFTLTVFFYGVNETGQIKFCTCRGQWSQRWDLCGLQNWLQDLCCVKYRGFQSIVFLGRWYDHIDGWNRSLTNQRKGTITSYGNHYLNNESTGTGFVIPYCILKFIEKNKKLSSDKFFKVSFFMWIA
jgi:hypothetical protein